MCSVDKVKKTATVTFLGLREHIRSSRGFLAFRELPPYAKCVSITGSDRGPRKGLLDSVGPTGVSDLTCLDHILDHILCCFFHSHIL